MTDTQHTPGPWSYHYEPTLYRHIVRSGFAGDRSICVTYGAGATSYECAANARLIAAAPDLLEVLGDILPWLEKAEAEGVFENCAAPKGGQRAINRARAAIAKATGA